MTFDVGYNRDAVAEALRKGGHEAISLFLQISIELHRAGGTPAVNGWIKKGLSVLPEIERCALFGMLIEVLAENYDLEFPDEKGPLN